MWVKVHHATAFLEKMHIARNIFDNIFSHMKNLK